MNEVLRFAGVRKAFGSTEVLQAVSLSVKANERVALIGPSGSGKSTLLRMAAGLEFPDSGSVETLGTPVGEGRSVRDIRRNLLQVRAGLGVVFQSYNLFPHMTVLANLIEAPVHVQKVPREQAVERAHDLLERVGLSAKVDSRPAELSGGQQQRAALARALMTRPQLLLLDEVTSALDPQLVDGVLEVIVSIAEEENVAMLVVTHELGFARRIADTVHFLSEGNVVESGPPAQVIDAPLLQRTREFVGL
ncbi:amino acid ABC transporter ATP-binding protein [Leucobacter sp. CSA1]|uniref:Amino acid ABC transporter ATP-binding protein n=1 Tax=Leucobacter chromiisoli TaxID=2796471 RepID=A0A934Q8J2_9MICO|nr:amino acid ABC transporter ATP-binding protein [Leucobacter chromiisoli]MBK0418797.1 amino acid ABC transporter ATP-binding protein [Leucobacter chromiisoli]